LNVTRSRLEALLAFGWHRLGRDDGCRMVVEKIGAAV
jgi:hypothetical protein